MDSNNEKAGSSKFYCTMLRAHGLVFTKLRIFLFKTHHSKTLLSSLHPSRCLQGMAEVSSPSSSAFTEPTKDDVIARLRQTDAADMLAGLPPLPTSVPRAAVLVPLFYRNSQLHVLLTVRSSNLSSHRGEVAFPGGKSDEGDADLRETALRESEEEIGLARDRVEIISQLSSVFARRGTLVVPFVGFIPEDFDPVPNPEEVQDVFTVPFATFLQSSEDHKQRVWTDSGQEFLLDFFTHYQDGKQITTFGLTAIICITAASICFGRSPDFESLIKFDSSNPRKIHEISKKSYMRQVRKYEKAKQGNL
ncbi:peroxisomal coenzyme A diphosphatase NUDT7-like [Patiria miniata]|uniref:Nudix hydrolase domain-containing protein n=1 Tax=Patiria miniata TaxID=46514 RepID=A0A914AUI9_PATMI|nr:peroxisomal coenzyme A diphosphatase NUDT7-like [Patiria miniata]